MRDNSINQGRILRNLMRLLDAAYRHSYYEVLPRGVQLWLPEQGMGLYPDAMVIAGEPLLHHGHGDKVLNPCVVFEIVSEPVPTHNPEAAQMGDRSKMFTNCRGIPICRNISSFTRTKCGWSSFTAPRKTSGA
jgi:Uma2 family endonuclease